MRFSLFYILILISSVGYSQLTLQVGDLAPEISLKDSEEKVLHLSDHLKEITIVHFWASWSRACIPMNNQLNQYYNKYKKEGLEIFSVSIDKKKKSWTKAIHDQKIGWKHHVCDFRGLIHSKPAKDYFLFEVPTIFLLDQNGKIIAINPDQTELSSILKRLETNFKILPDRTSEKIFLTKKSDYIITDTSGVSVLAGKGQAINISSLDYGDYIITANQVNHSFEKTDPANDIEFQINYKIESIILYQAVNYVLKSKNGNILMRGYGTSVPYKELGIKNKDDYFLVLPNNTYLIMLD